MHGYNSIKSINQSRGGVGGVPVRFPMTAQHYLIAYDHVYVRLLIPAADAILQNDASLFSNAYKLQMHTN